MAIDYSVIGDGTANTGIYEILKFVYGTGLTNQFADEKTTYNQFPKSGRKPSGKGYVFGVREARAQSVGARLESGKLPDPLVGKHDQGKILPRYIYGSMRITGPAIEAAKGDAAAFVDSLSDGVEDIYQSVVVQLNRMAWGDSFGHVATLSAASSQHETNAYTIYCDNDMEVRYLQNGGLYDIYVSDGSAPEDDGTGTAGHLAIAQRVSAIDPVAHSVTFETDSAANYGANHPRTDMASATQTTTTLEDNAMVIAMGARELAHASSDTPVEMMGLLGIYDDGTLLDTFEDIDADSYPYWRANKLTNGGVARELSMDLMLRALDLSRRSAGAKPSFMRMGLGQRRKYANLLLPDVRFQPTVLKGGYETLTFAGGDGTVTIVIDPIAQPNKIFFEPEGSIAKYEMTPLGWGALDQQMHQRAGYDEWDCFLRIYTNLGTEQRNNLTLLGDLVEPTLF